MSNDLDARLLVTGCVPASSVREIPSKRRQQLFLNWRNCVAPNSPFRWGITSNATVDTLRRGECSVKVFQRSFAGGRRAALVGFSGRTCDHSPDWQRFLVFKSVSEPSALPPQLIVVQHFDEELKRLMPAIRSSRGARFCRPDSQSSGHSCVVAKCLSTSCTVGPPVPSTDPSPAREEKSRRNAPKRSGLAESVAKYTLIVLSSVPR
jgi:hypothetical protein